MMQQYMKELEQDPFGPEEFVERLAYRTIAETQPQSSSGDFDPLLLHDSFTQAIKDLSLLQDRQQKKCERLEMIVREDENVFRREVHGLLEANRTVHQTFRGLDEKMVTVAGKVLHLGDQLDGVNGPRARAQEAHRLLTHLNTFLTQGPEETSPIFLDATRLDETAHIIQKLHVISKDLTAAEDLTRVKQKVERTYDDTERALINEFAAAQRRHDLNRMKSIAATLFLFKGYSQCVDAYIEQSQAGCLLVTNVFSHLLNLCEQNFGVIKTVFSNPTQVMGKFVLNIYHLKLQEYISERLSKKMDTLTYLQTLYDLYSKTNQLSDGLAKFDIGNDKTFLTKLTTNIFSKHTHNYVAMEIGCLRERFAALLSRYYEQKRHVKRPVGALGTGLAAGATLGLQELKRDIQAAIAGAGVTTVTATAMDGGTAAAVPVAVAQDIAEAETLLSDELAITMLQDTRNAFQRCQLLTRGGPEDVGGAAAAILDRLMNSLLTEHVDYAVEVGVQGVQTAGVVGAPTLHFLAVVHRAHSITHLLDTQFKDVILPLIHNTAKYNDSMHKKRFVMDDIELKINNGIDRSLTMAVNWIKSYLQSEQRRTDFRPDSEDIEPRATPACRAVCPYIAHVCAQVRSKLDERNVATVLQEFGVRVHRVIYDHLLQFQYSMAGAMIAVCDINEYRHATKPLGPFTVTLFETLHSLSNLLLVKPENLQQVCAQDSLVNLDRSVVDNFIQLRSDYKAQKPLFLRV